MKNKNGDLSRGETKKVRAKSWQTKKSDYHQTILFWINVLNLYRFDTMPNQSTRDYLISILTPLSEVSDIGKALLYIITHNDLSPELLESLRTIVNNSIRTAIKESDRNLLTKLKDKLDAIRLAEAQEKASEPDPDLVLRSNRP